MNSIFKHTILTSLVAISPLTIAQDDTKETGPVSASVGFGYLSTTGNTETTSFKGHFDIKGDYERWIHNLKAEALFTEGRSNETDSDIVEKLAEKYEAAYQSDRKFGRKNASVFAHASHVVDKFSGFEYQSTASLGYSDAIYKNDTSHILYSVGPGYSVYKTEETITDGVTTMAETTDGAIVYAFGEFLYNISETSKFTQTVSTDIAAESENNTRVKSVTALSLTIYGSFDLKLAYTIDHNTEVAIGKEGTDTDTSFTLVYNYN